MKISTKGMTRKQLTTILEGMIRNDNTCITEGDMCTIFSMFADDYEAEVNGEEMVYELTKLNNYWSDIRMFLPRLGDRLKGFKLI